MNNLRAGMIGALAMTGMGAAIFGAAEFIAPHEGLVLKTYKDPAGYNTACLGNRTAAVEGFVFTEDECLLLFLSDLIPHVIVVSKLAPDATLDLDDWIALTSFSFNLGHHALARSTLLKFYNAGDRAGARAEFHRWVHAAGIPLKGLITRRAMESALLAAGVQFRRS